MQNLNMQNLNMQDCRLRQNMQNSNMQNSVAIFTFSNFDHNYLSCLIQKIKILSLTLKLGAWTEYPDSVVMFTFSNFDHKYCFYLVQKVKIISLNLKFVTQNDLNMQNLMVMFTFLSYNGNTLFEQIWSKESKSSINSQTQSLD